MFFSAWREKIFLEEISINLTLLNGSDNNVTDDVSPIPDAIWATRVGVFAIGGTAIALLGLLCNTISIVILAHFRQKSSAPFLLICLEVVDSVLLLSEMVLETLTTLSQAELLTDAYRAFITPVYVNIFPLPHIAQTVTTLMTVIITIERYVAVAKPLLASTVCSRASARKAVVGVLVWAGLFHIPLYMAYSYEHRYDAATNISRIVFYRTTFGKSDFYNDWFVVWINFIFEFFLPFALIVVFNVLMIRALHASHSLTSTTSSSSSSSKIDARKKRSLREGRLTGMVVAVTIIFFVCELFPAVALIIVRGKDAFNECSVACAHFVSIADTMVLLNSGVNFVAYCAIGKQFRDLFVQIFTPKRRVTDWRRRKSRKREVEEEEGMKGGADGELESPLFSRGEESDVKDTGVGDRSPQLLLCENHHHHPDHQHQHQHHHRLHKHRDPEGTGELLAVF